MPVGGGGPGSKLQQSEAAMHEPPRGNRDYNS